MELKNVGWIGTGVMGKSMCTHILNAGHTVYVYNRTKQKAAFLIENGAFWCESPEEVAEKSDIIFSIVGFPEDVEEIILGHKSILKRAKRGAVIVDMTTSSPILAVKIYTIAKEKGIFSLDAPVSGGDIGAREGKLAIMVGGDRDIYDRVMPLFEIIGENIAHMGKAGSGQHTKMANQILIAGTMIGVVESLLYAYKTGMDLIAKGDFDPGFYIKHFIKDMGIALDEAKRMNLALPGLALVHQFYIAATSLGYDSLGTQGLYKVFQKINRI